MKAFPLWIKPMGPSNQRSHLWPLKQLSCVEERHSNPAHGRVAGHLSGGEHQRLYAEAGDGSIPAGSRVLSCFLTGCSALFGRTGPAGCSIPFFMPVQLFATR